MFGFGKESRLKRASARITQKYGPAENRQKAIDTLKDAGTPEAIAALLTRFKLQVEPSITDQEEKQYVFDALVEFGEEALQPIADFVRREEAITWPLRALEKIGPEARVVSLVCDELERMGGGYTRDPEKKMILLQFLEGRRDPRIAAALLPYLEDLADEVQIASAGRLGEIADPIAREPLIQLLLREKDNLRVRQAVAESLRRGAYSVEGFRPSVEALLPPPYFLDREGRVRTPS